MRRINLLLQQPKRKKYRKLSRWATLYGQTYGPKLVASNFALEPWSLALGGYFTRHGQRSGATQATARLLRQLYQGLRGLRGTHRWVLQLAEDTIQSHQRPEFLYSHLRQRFPQKNLERQRRWIKRLRRRALVVDHHRRQRERRKLRWELLQQQRQQKPAMAPRRLEAHPHQGTLSLSTVRQLPRLALLRHTQLQLWWETPRPLLTAGRYLRLRQRYGVEIHRWGRARSLQRTRGQPRLRGKRRSGHRWGAALERRRGSGSTRKTRNRVRKEEKRRENKPEGENQAENKKKREREGEKQQPVSAAATPSRRRLWPLGGRKTPRRPRRLLRTQTLGATLVSAQKLLQQLNRLNPRGVPTEELAHPLMVLRTLMGRLLRLRHFCGLMDQKATQTYGYARYKSKFFGQKTRQRLQQLLRVHCSIGALRRRQRCLIRTLARLERLGHRCLDRLEELLGWESGPAPGAVTQAPELVSLWQLLQHRVLQAGKAKRALRGRLNVPFEIPQQQRQLLRLLRRGLRRALRHPSLRRFRPQSPQSLRQSRKPEKRRGRSSLNPPARRSPRIWRGPRGFRRSPSEPFDPQQWRRLINRHWPTLQAQQLYGLNLYWEAPRSGQLGRWRRRSRSARQPRRSPGQRRGCRSGLPRNHRRPLYQPARRLLRRRLAFRPQVHYTVRELHLQDLALLEELEQEGLEIRDFGQRYLLVTRRYGAVGYGTLLRDCFALLTPQLRLVSQVVGHKSARRTIYQVRFGVPLEQRVRALFGWLRDLVNKNEDYNLLRRNTARKPASKRVRDKPERSRRSTQSFHPRLTTELRRLMGADEPLLEQLALFDSRSSRVRVPRRHYRWEG